MGGKTATRTAQERGSGVKRPEVGTACAGGALKPGTACPAEPSCPSPEGITAAQAQVLLPAELLQPGEIIVLLLKPSPWFILLWPLRSLAAIVLAGVGLSWLTQWAPIGLTRTDAVILTVLLVTLRMFWGFLEWLSRVYVLTDRRVIRVKGVLRIDVFETPLKNVQHTSTLFSLRERLVGLGTIAFATAGTAFVEAAWEMVTRPLEVHRVVVQTLNRYR